MQKNKKYLPSRKLSNHNEIDKFIRDVSKSRPPLKTKGRLLFSMDATASREMTWDRACAIQGEMFESTALLGGLSVQLAYYRGYREFYASEWLNSSQALVRRMTGVKCLGGHTQIQQVLKHAVREAEGEALSALVFVGDSMEENIDDLCALAGKLGLLNVPAFMFQEGSDSEASVAFQQVAKLTGGAYLQFDTNSADQLQRLLRAVAVFAAGGQKALDKHGRREGGAALQISHQVK